ncbi:MAG: molybdopterin molybdotransferase MoeA [Armatimonadetes bacterium]|nr:molybdopterin molybdotransferase MoeA [Armatimonadota bacterium]
MTPPLPVESALERVLACCRRLPAESVALAASLGRVTHGEVHSDLDLPPFDNSAVDGYAVRAGDLAATDRLPVQTTVAAGDQPVTLLPGHAAKIMTGAPLPAGADAVVMVEQTETVDGQVRFGSGVRLGAHCRRVGEDLRRGGVVVRDGTTIGHPEMALLAAVGAAEVAVARRPRAAVVSTGDELVDITVQPRPGQLRDSSLYALPAQLAAWGVEIVEVARAADSPEALEPLFGRFEELDLVLTAGGVSMGDRDFVRPVFERLGQPEFWRVAIKPGKPLLFGRLGQALFFGLPGNPVSSMVTTDLFVRPAVDALLGRRDGARLQVRGRLSVAFRSDANRTEYVRVVAEPDADGVWQALPTGDQSSGMMTSMQGANAYAVVPIGTAEVPAGGEVLLELFARKGTLG